MEDQRDSSHLSSKMCGWKFNTGLTLFVFFVIVVNSLFGGVGESSEFGATNLSMLPWVKQGSTSEAITGLAIIALVFYGLSFFIAQSWNRLIVKMFSLKEMSMGESYSLMLWLVLIHLLIK